VPDPKIINNQDVILKVRASAACGSDLHLGGGYIPFMQAGDVLGHEFIGEIVEVGKGVRDRSVGDRVVVSSFVGCGRCWYCMHDQWSLCDNTNTNPAYTQGLWGYEPGACFGYSHAMGGLPGSHESPQLRVPPRLMPPNSLRVAPAAGAASPLTCATRRPSRRGRQPSGTARLRLPTL
jgi:threonine dehydrogenase-like Zn-dependent dehydrogenase